TDEDRGRRNDSGEDESSKARPEEPEEQRVPVRRERTEPVDHVPRKEIAARKLIRDDPLPARVDDRVRPLAPRDDEQRDRRGRESRRARRLPPRHGPRRAPVGATRAPFFQTPSIWRRLATLAIGSNLSTTKSARFPGSSVPR